MCTLVRKLYHLFYPQSCSFSCSCVVKLTITAPSSYLQYVNKGLRNVCLQELPSIYYKQHILLIFLCNLTKTRPKCTVVWCQLKVKHTPVEVYSLPPHLQLNCRRLGCIVGNVGTRPWQGREMHEIKKISALVLCNCKSNVIREQSVEYWFERRQCFS